MRLWIFSDLHLSSSAARENVVPDGGPPDADVAVVAGDVTDGAIPALAFLARALTPRLPVVAVLGNHEFFGEAHGRARREAAAFAASVPGLHLLDDGEAIVAGVRFVGGTLWSDYALLADGDEGRIRAAMAHARRALSDHSQIEMAGPEPGVMSRDWAPSDARRAHRDTVAYLDRALGELRDGPTVVVTHHAPHPACVAPRFCGDALTPAFASDLSGLIARRRPALWVHGHTHDRVDVSVGATRILCNPRGFGGDGSAYDPRLVVEVCGPSASSGA